MLLVPGTRGHLRRCRRRRPQLLLLAGRRRKRQRPPGARVGDEAGADRGRSATSACRAYQGSVPHGP